MEKKLSKMVWGVVLCLAVFIPVGPGMAADPIPIGILGPFTGSLAFNAEEMKKGMVLAVEPMVSEGDWRVQILEDGWTAVTRDRSRAAHFEHSVAITENGPLVLSCP